MARMEGRDGPVDGAAVVSKGLGGGVFDEDIRTLAPSVI